VAKLFGKLLKEFGFLSSGEVIMVTPADLKGDTVGSSGTKTRAILEQAKGNILFIDEVCLFFSQKNVHTQTQA